MYILLLLLDKPFEMEQLARRRSIEAVWSGPANTQLHVQNVLI